MGRPTQLLYSTRVQDHLNMTMANRTVPTQSKGVVIIYGRGGQWNSENCSHSKLAPHYVFAPHPNQCTEILHPPQRTYKLMCVESHTDIPGRQKPVKSLVQAKKPVTLLACNMFACYWLRRKSHSEASILARNQTSTGFRVAIYSEPVTCKKVTNP